MQGVNVFMWAKFWDSAAIDLLDFSKAFDKVPHTRLLNNKTYGEIVTTLQTAQPTFKNNKLGIS